MCVHRSEGHPAGLHPSFSQGMRLHLRQQYAVQLLVVGWVYASDLGGRPMGQQKCSAMRRGGH